MYIVAQCENLYCIIFTVCPMTAEAELTDADAATCLRYSETIPAQVEPLLNVTTQCQPDPRNVTLQITLGNFIS